jgi:hypothetical protein
VTGATSLSIDRAVGAVAGTSAEVAVTTSTLFTLTAAGAGGTATASTLVYVAHAGSGVDPPSGNRYAAMVAPVDGETFLGPTTDLRLVGVGFDANNYQGSGHSQAAALQFFVDGTIALEVKAADSEYWVFKGFATGLALAPGTHTVMARAIYVEPAGSADSPPVTITIQSPPSYARTIDLTGDLTLVQAASWIGSSSARIRVNGHGHRIRDAGSAAAVDWQYVDFHDLGDPGDTGATGIDVATTGNITVQGCRFDFSNPVRFALGGSSIASIRDNLWRSNMRQPIGQGPDSGGGSYPAVYFTGKSTGASVFAGNTLGAGWVDWSNVSNWTIGGDTDADGNVAIGPRVGFFFDVNASPQSTHIRIRRNFTHHVYFGGWSQGSNYELGGIRDLVAEHNVLIGSSWTVRGVGAELRYNLLLNGGEDWVWMDHDAGYLHHNVFVGGDLNRSGVYAIYGNTGIRVLDNTFDGMSSRSEINAVLLSSGAETVSSNIFLNLPVTPVDVTGGTLTADHNLFWNSGSPSYGDLRSPASDVHADPLLANPAGFAYEFDERAVWERSLSAHDILVAYRARYTPGAGSPALGAGDPSLFGAGNAAGAIGATGAAAGADLFGK